MRLIKFIQTTIFEELNGHSSLKDGDEDEDGLLYHGSKKLFDKFDINKVTIRGLKYGYGIYFSKNISVAREFNNDYIYICRIKNKNLLNWNLLTKRQYDTFKQHPNITLDKYDTTFGHIFGKLLRYYNSIYATEKYTDKSLMDIYKYLVNLGFDGIFSVDEYCIFKPDNIIIIKVIE